MKNTHTNRLINETSPYLLQHSHNPVDWFPWNQEALDKAKKEDKLLLVSIGYSACHWCHVMEHESFEDEEVAQLMNQHFVCIKVDREERPDVDQVYMDAIQLLTGRGGWPLNCFALPDGRPVYGGTYFRKADWMSLLRQLAQLNANEKQKLINQANAIHTGVLKQENSQIASPNQKISKEQLTEGMQKMAAGFDLQNGGFNGAPKFPMPSVLNYLLSYLHLEKDVKIKQHLFLTLDRIALGGIYDHVGGGFARYSVDDEWHVPHFEKMLYDNAQLISTYSKAYQLKPKEHYKRVVYESIGFIKRELTSTEGAFYAALDADSEGEEGKFYVWTADELKYHFGDSYPILAEYYSVTEEGNWENGVNVLKAVAPAEQFSAEKKIPLNDFLGLLETAETKLLAERNLRVKPGLDDKILTSWNALMLIAYIDAYNAFGNETFRVAALNSANFIKNKILNSDGSLHRTYKNGESRISAFLDDYAFTSLAFTALYQITFDETWLYLSKEITDHTIKYFADDDGLFFYYTSSLDAPLAVRKKEISDNVIPSSNSAMAENMMNLSKYFGETEYRNRAETMLHSLAYEVNSYGRFYSNWGRLLCDDFSDQKEIVITGPKAKAFTAAIKKLYHAKALYAVTDNKSNLPIFENRITKEQTLIYVCQNNTCMLPVSSIDEALALIQQE